MPEATACRNRGQEWTDRQVQWLREPAEGNLGRCDEREAGSDRGPDPIQGAA
jgi:hypothetical protein